MYININYHKQFSKEINDFVIVLSKFSELKTIIGLPIDTILLYKTKEIEKILNEHSFYQTYIRSHNSNILYNIKILLVKNTKNSNFTELGARLYSKYHIESSSDINFIFSQNILREN